MAIMGRKKKAVAAGWNAINKQRNDKSKSLTEKEEKKEVSPEEHEERLKKLREIGLIK